MLFRQKLLTMNMILFSVGIIIFAVIFAGVFSENRSDLIQDHALQTTEALAQQLARPETDIKNFEIEKTSFEDFFVIGLSGEVHISTLSPSPEKITDFIDSKNLEGISTSGLSSGITYSAQHIITYSVVGNKDLIVLGVINRKHIGRTNSIFIQKASFLLVSLMALVFIAGFIFSHQLTKGLGELSKALEKVSSGDWTARVEVFSEDEIGSLSSRFNDMAQRIKANLDFEIEKVRITSDMEVAQEVQKYLFKNPKFENDYCSIYAFYRPASECAGDWWGYYQVGSKLIGCIGDVTGHGISSALLTSAARSCFSVLERSQVTSTNQICQQMNQVLFETTQGRLQMTAFVFCIDAENNQMTYTNASHDVPMILPQATMQGKIKKSDIEWASEVNGPRFGEKLEANYTETQIEIKKGQRLVTFTDGVMDIPSGNQKKITEREFISKVSVAHTPGSTPHQFIERFTKEIGLNKQGLTLPDDVSMMIIDIKN